MLSRSGVLLPDSFVVQPPPHRMERLETDFSHLSVLCDKNRLSLRSGVTGSFRYAAFLHSSQTIFEIVHIKKKTW